MELIRNKRLSNAVNTGMETAIVLFFVVALALGFYQKQPELAITAFLVIGFFVALLVAVWLIVRVIRYAWTGK